MATKLKLNEKMTARIGRVLSRGKVFVLFLEGEDVPVILAKRIAADDFYVHKSQLVGVTVTVTPTQQSIGELPGFLAEVDLPIAAASNHELIMHSQQRANDYSQALVYAQSAPLQA